MYLCAGFSKPKFMVDSTEEEFKGVRSLLLYLISCLPGLVSVFLFYFYSDLRGALPVYDADSRD